MLERLKRHWLVATATVCAVVSGTTWQVARVTMVEPRDFAIAQLKDRVQQLEQSCARPEPKATAETTMVLEPTGVFADSSVTTLDGRCSIRVVSIQNDKIFVSVAVDSRRPLEFKDQSVGSRLAIDAGESTYFVDLHRLRGNLIDLSVHRTTKR